MAKIREFFSNHPLIANICLIFIVGLILVWGTMLFLDHWTMHGDTEVVPDVRNMSYAEARQELARHNLDIEIADSIYDTRTARGTVIETMPRHGAIVKRGRQVYATITAFTPKQVTVTMPLQGNVSERQAMSYLRGLGLTDIRTIYVPSDYPDLVVSARYGDTPIVVGSVLPVTATVTLEIGTVPVHEPDDDEIFGTDNALDEYDYSTTMGLSED